MDLALKIVQAFSSVTHCAFDHIHWPAIPYTKDEFTRTQRVGSFLVSVFAEMINMTDHLVYISEDKDAWKLPRNLEDLRKLNAVLAIYIGEHYWNVYFAFFSTYI
jgi:hypothetical protein